MWLPAYWEKYDRVRTEKRKQRLPAATWERLGMIMPGTHLLKWTIPHYLELISRALKEGLFLTLTMDNPLPLENGTLFLPEAVKDGADKANKMAALLYRDARVLPTAHLTVVDGAIQIPLIPLEWREANLVLQPRTTAEIKADIEGAITRLARIAENMNSGEQSEPRCRVEPAVKPEKALASENTGFGQAKPYAVSRLPTPPSPSGIADAGGVEGRSLNGQPPDDLAIQTLTVLSKRGYRQLGFLPGPGAEPIHLLTPVPVTMTAIGTQETRTIEGKVTALVPDVGFVVDNRTLVTGIPFLGTEDRKVGCYESMLVRQAKGQARMQQFEFIEWLKKDAEYPA